MREARKGKRVRQGKARGGRKDVIKEGANE
jgi:hypothetical protein